jgi:hypothetical protein
MPRTLGGNQDSRHQRQAARWATVLARRTGKRPATHEAELHGREPLQGRLAGHIDAMASVGYWRGIAKIVAPIRAAVSQLPDMDMTPALFRLVQEADAAEEVAETTFLSSPSPATLRAWRLALEGQMGADLLLHRAICAEESR